MFTGMCIDLGELHVFLAHMTLNTDSFGCETGILIKWFGVHCWLLVDRTADYHRSFRQNQLLTWQSPKPPVSSILAEDAKLSPLDTTRKCQLKEK